MEVKAFSFRPWVRRAGLSIVAVASAATIAIGIVLFTYPEARFGWVGEPFVWLYLATLWLGGVKVWIGARRPVAEADEEGLTVRPLHHLRQRTMRWDRIAGTEQMIGGDRLMIFHDTDRGRRFVALNLNLVKGRREFLTLLDERLRARGFREKTVERSRYLSPPE